MTLNPVHENFPKFLTATQFSDTPCSEISTKYSNNLVEVTNQFSAHSFTRERESPDKVIVVIFEIQKL